MWNVLDHLTLVGQHVASVLPKSPSVASFEASGMRITFKARALDAPQRRAWGLHRVGPPAVRRSRSSLGGLGACGAPRSWPG
jgi:hypothetical protein